MWGGHTKFKALFMVPLFITISSVHAETCSFVVDFNEFCVESLDCTSNGNIMKIYEDCQVGGVLFTYTDDSLVQDETAAACKFLKKDTIDKTFKLQNVIDAEAIKGRIPCQITTDSVLTFIEILDINEFDPQPVTGNKVEEVNVEENLLAHDILTFEYTDDDKGEAETLQFTLITGNLDGIFSTSSQKGVNKTAFTIRSLTELDYEGRMFYKLEYKITSTDTRGNERTISHTVFVYVTDVGDNPPYWLQSYPTFLFLEGVAGRELFSVIAEDRDLVINNPIRYNITSGNEEDYFAIDEDTGSVTLQKDIDREVDTAFFILEITAQEFIETTGEPAPPPSASITVTNLNIDDENDNIPTFSKTSYEITMDEVADVDVFMNFDIPIFVFDMDPKGDYGRYDITSDYSNDIRINPSNALGNTTLQLTALAKPNTIFNYEERQEVIVTLTATEKSDSSHVSTATLTVTLNDANDHKPQFLQAEYTVAVEEDKRTGYHLLNVSAIDDDSSDTFGSVSIAYSSGCPFLSVDGNTGEVTLGQDNYLDFESDPIVQCLMYADDNKGNAPTLRDTTTLIITVLDVVDSPPVIRVQPGDITENSLEGIQVGKEIIATDPDVDADIEIVIDWQQSSAQKDGEEITVYIIGWFELVGFSGSVPNYTVQLQTGTVNIDREIADTVSLKIVVTDKATVSGSDKSTGDLVITINDEKDTAPVLSPRFNLTVEENVDGGTLIDVLVAVDADVDDSVTFSIDDNSLVYVEKSSEDDFKLDLFVNKSALIDREKQDKIIVNITVTDSVGMASFRVYTITVTDVNDNTPDFNNDVILASFTESDSINKIIQTFEARDLDLNEVLNYTLLEDFEWHEGGPVPPPKTPFLITTQNNVASLVLNFDPVGINSGYCNFTIVCYDNENVHSSSIEGKVYAITIAYQISVIFVNDPTEVQSQRKEIESIFIDVYKYDCNINSIAENTGKSTSTKEGSVETLVKMHFIDEVKNEPVAAEVIIEATNNDAVAQELSDRMTARGLSLKSVGNTVVDISGNSNSQVLLLQILLAVVSLVLGSFLLLLLITFCIRTKKLQRQLKVAKATTFGSMSSNINRTEVTAVPGSNKFAGEGANPMYNVEDTDLRNDDASSTSGDSVLVGVEENPEFKEYRAPVGGSKDSYSNASFSRSIDDVAGPSPFAGGARTNPLLDINLDSNDNDFTEAMDNYDKFIRRQSDSSGDSFGANTNPNFSFGPGQ